METGDVKKRFATKKLILIGGVLLIVVVLAVASLQLLIPKGWSKDVRFDDGRMAMLVQFKVEPDPPVVGTVALMGRVKDMSGYLMPVDHVHFSLSRNGQSVTEAIEGKPIGKFSVNGDGFYKALAELLSPGAYQVDLEVQHNQSSFRSSWPLEVKQ